MHELDTISILLASISNVVVTFIVLLYIPLYFIYYIPHVNYMYINKFMLRTCLFSPGVGGGGGLKLLSRI